MVERSSFRALEPIAREVADEWGLRLGGAFEMSHHSFVAPVGDDAVLKVTPAHDYESDHEADALAHWDGKGAVRMLRQHPGRRALLLERAVPGGDLAGMPEAEATSAAVAIGLQLWRPAGAPFRRVAQYVPRWLANAAARTRPALELLELARTICPQSPIAEEVLLHGDFHHHNLLRAGGRYVAIDPKPMLGEPEFDVAPFLWNPLGYEMTHALTVTRLAAFAEAGLDEQRMRTWAIVRGAYLGAEDQQARVLLSLL